MKYLLLLALVMLILWLWQGKRRATLTDKAKKSSATGRSQPLQATEIVACDVCSVHLPRTEALTSGHGVYCSDAHRRQAER